MAFFFSVTCNILLPQPKFDPMPLAVEAKNVNHWISKGSLYVFKIGREDTQAELHKDDHTKTEAMAGVKPLQAEECQRLLAIRRARRKQQEVCPPPPRPLQRLQRKHGPTNTLILECCLQNYMRINFCSFNSSKFVVTCFSNPRK